MADPVTLQTILELAIALLLALIAYYNQQRTKLSASVANAAEKTAASNAQMAAAPIAAPGASAVVAPSVAPITLPVVPQDPVSMGPGQPAGYPVPIYSTRYKMREFTKEYLRLAITDPKDWASVEAQIQAAEDQNLPDYVITWSHARWARITFGMWMATNGQYTYISQVNGGAFDDSQGWQPKPAGVPVPAVTPAVCPAPVKNQE